jgi:hypothetical protein
VYLTRPASWAIEEIRRLLKRQAHRGWKPGCDLITYVGCDALVSLGKPEPA